MKIQFTLQSWQISGAREPGHIIWGKRVGGVKRRFSEFHSASELFTQYSADSKCIASNFFFLLISQIRYGNLAVVARSLSTCGRKVTVYKSECFPDLRPGCLWTFAARGTSTSNDSLLLHQVPRPHPSVLEGGVLHHRQMLRTAVCVHDHLRGE